MKIISRKEARKKKLTRFFTGKPCKRGHVAAQRVDNYCCVDCCRENLKIWRRANPSLYKAQWRRSDAAHADERRAYSRKYSKDHPRIRDRELIRQYQKKWRSEHRESERAMSKRYKYFGPIKLTGDKQWLSKNQALLRGLRRMLRHPNQDHSGWLKEASPTLWSRQSTRTPSRLT